ncbi:hypothetical protein HYDPIDRAFT_43148 [Hydnomerulius pinastri MD-312]|uniref:Uncharacterized protein n=1 Tax=Hydnomerulius pinastri MD-312 TaxID=994086 RepID=A0A0C9W397_9AGAM|nr:hypothetical protein HYDPIDRAFT_43148 [Hydnomerulius pinastri MD-312]
MPTQAVRDFWSDVLKDRQRMNSYPIPCIDGDTNKYCDFPGSFEVHAKLLECKFQDLPPKFSSGFYTCLPASEPCPTLRIWIPYVEIHGEDNGVPPAEQGHAGDVYVAQDTSRPTFWIRGSEKWSSVEPNVISEHPIVTGYKATYRGGTVIWEAIIPCRQLKFTRRPPKKNPVAPSSLLTQRPVAKRARPPTLPPQRQGGEIRGANVASAAPLSILAPGSRSSAVDAVSGEAVTPTSKPSAPFPGTFSLKRMTRTGSESSCADRNTKRVRISSPAEVESSPQGASKKTSVAASAPGTPSNSSNLSREARTASTAPTPNETLKSLQGVIQRNEKDIKYLNEELSILRKRNAELCTDKVNGQQDRERLEDEVKSVKEESERREKVLAESQSDLDQTRGQLTSATDAMRALAGENVSLTSKLHLAHATQQDAEMAEVSSQGLIIGLRHTLLRERSEHQKLKKAQEESNHRHAQQYATLESVILDAKESLLRSHAAEATLREEMERLQGALQASLATSRGLQREVNDERGNTTRLQDEVQRLETEVKALLALSRAAETAGPPGASAVLNPLRLQSLPPELQTTITPFLDSMCNHFSKMQEEVNAVKERADSANEMYVKERDAHEQSKKASDDKLNLVVEERDAALRSSQSSQRELSQLRTTLGRLALTDN